MNTVQARRPLSRPQRIVLAAAFVPMLATGGAGAYGTFSNISGAYGEGTALGAVAAGEGATAVLALVLLGLTMLGQSSPAVVRAGLWALPGAASAMAAMAGENPGTTLIYALTPLGMSVSAEGMAFLARRIVVHQDGRDTEAETKAAAVVASLAYHRARAANHPDTKVRERSERVSWRLARKVGRHDTALGVRLLDVQRERLTDGADAALAGMFGTPVTPPVTNAARTTLPGGTQRPALEGVTPDRDADDTQVNDGISEARRPGVTPVTPEPVTAPDIPAEDDHEDDQDDAGEQPVVPVVTLAEVAAVAGVTTPEPGEQLADAQLVVVLRHLRYATDPPRSYRQAAATFREAGFVGAEARVRAAWGELLTQEETTP